MIKIFGDCANLKQMSEFAFKVSGWTTNPSLMRKAGVNSYEVFSKRLIATFPNIPLSLEVFSDDFDEMDAQARKISAWGHNVYVKVPVTNTKGQSAGPLIHRLCRDGLKVNVTAVFSTSQIDEVFGYLETAPAIVSVFAGRIADTGRNPNPIILHALRKRATPLHEILWASTRQVMDVYIADAIGCDIITVTPELIDKLPLEGKNLKEYSLETVKMLFDDAKAAGYQL